MINKLRFLFNYQRFTDNKKMAALITETENRYSHVVSEDELAYVSAAGDTDILRKHLSDKGDD